MLPYPDIDPVIVAIGPLKVRWYGLMYVLGFAASYFLVLRQLRQRGEEAMKPVIENLNFTLILSLILGGRLGYVLIYNLPYYLDHPAEIAATWQGGMSFHGALTGVILGGVWFCKKNKLDFWAMADLYVVTVPIGLGLGRIGNFINGELFGRVSDVPWAMVFPGGGPLPRHPSQLYEFLLEGVLLFLILWRFKEKKFPPGSMLGLFLICYGVLRSVAELFRQPDAQIGFLFGGLTMGQILSLTMIAAGALIFHWRRRAPAPTSTRTLT